MQTPATEIDQMIVQLDEFILPSSLMESFDVYREESVKRAARGFNDAQLSWFLDMLNRFRGPDDRKDSLVDVFDPGMYTCDHPAWEAAPGTGIEMPARTSEVAQFVDRNSRIAEIAREKSTSSAITPKPMPMKRFSDWRTSRHRHWSITGKTFQGREAIRYLALNASAVLEDLWAADDTLWKNAPVRHIQFDDMVAKRREICSRPSQFSQNFEERDFACYSEDEIRKFAFDIRSLFLTDRAKHVAICTRCQTRLESWTKLVEKFEQSASTHNGQADA